jgi:hypothetical protein
MTKHFKDDLSLYLRNGRFDLLIDGKRENRIAVYRIRTISSPHFYEVLARLSEYHRDCLIHFHDPDTIAPDREGGLDYKPRLVEWNLEVPDSLPSPLRKVLEHMVLMHNQVASAEIRNRAAEMAIPDRIL